MAKKQDRNLPHVLDLSAGELVELLIKEAGESYTTLSAATGVDRSALSRLRTTDRLANEQMYRSLAKYAISQKIASV